MLCYANAIMLHYVMLALLCYAFVITLCYVSQAEEAGKAA